MAQENNKLEMEILCKFHQHVGMEIVEYLQRSSICSRKKLFDLHKPFTFSNRWTENFG